MCRIMIFFFKCSKESTQVDAFRVFEGAASVLLGRIQKFLVVNQKFWNLEVVQVLYFESTGCVTIGETEVFDSFFVIVDENVGGGDDRNLQLERRSFHKRQR